MKTEELLREAIHETGELRAVYAVYVVFRQRVVDKLNLILEQYLAERKELFELLSRGDEASVEKARELLDQ